MKKLLLLLLVFTGMVSTASAWDNLWMISGETSWAVDDDYQFTRVDADNFYYVLNATNLKTNDYLFRVKDKDNYWGAWSNEAVIGSVEYSAQKDQSYYSFKVEKNSKTKFAYIWAQYKYDTANSQYRWHFTVTYLETSTTVAFVDIDNNWTAPVYAYAWLSNGVKLLGNWQGTEMTYSNNVYTCEVPYASGATIKFSDKNASNNSSEMTLAEDAVYKYNAKVSSVNVSAGTLGKATFSCSYPLNFDGISTIKAYRITSASAGVLGLEQITGTVPAKTGLYIEGDANANYDVPTTVSASAVTTMLKAGTGVLVPVTESEGAITNFILTNKTTDNDSAPLKFYKVNDAGNTVPVGKAYLQIPTGSVGAHEFFWFEDDMTGIEKVSVDTKALNGAVYNLAGQRVAQPTKGLYIVNGKKVVLK